VIRILTVEGAQLGFRDDRILRYVGCQELVDQDRATDFPAQILRAATLFLRQV
jgi:hypothetical protein